MSTPQHSTVELERRKEGRRAEDPEPSPPKQGRGRASERLSVNLAPEVAQALRELALGRGISITEAVRQAISDEKYLQDAVNQGSRILVRDKDGSTRELVFHRTS